MNFGNTLPLRWKSCNCAHRSQILSSLGFSFRVFKMHRLVRGFHTYASFSSSTDVGSHSPPPYEPSVLADTRSLLQLMWDPPIHPLRSPTFLLAHRLVSIPLWGSASSLTYRLVFGSDNICNSPSPSLADIVLFGLSLSGFPSRF